MYFLNLTKEDYAFTQDASTFWFPLQTWEKIFRKIANGELKVSALLKWRSRNHRQGLHRLPWRGYSIGIKSWNLFKVYRAQILKFKQMMVEVIKYLSWFMGWLWKPRKEKGHGGLRRQCYQLTAVQQPRSWQPTKKRYTDICMTLLLASESKMCGSSEDHKPVTVQPGVWKHGIQEANIWEHSRVLWKCHDISSVDQAWASHEPGQQGKREMVLWCCCVIETVDISKT